jgi:RES domain-containing protein
VVLQVPSAVIPTEYNFLLNPLHKDFAKLHIGKALQFRFDPRLSAGP